MMRYFRLLSISNLVELQKIRGRKANILISSAIQREIHELLERAKKVEIIRREKKMILLETRAYFVMKKKPAVCKAAILN